MKWITAALLTLCATTSLFAEVAPEQVESMLEQMVQENVISAEEAHKAKFRMKAMTREQWSAINKEATRVAARTPASVTPSQNKIQEVNGIDLDGAQFKAIQNEVKKIIPAYKD